MVVVVVVVVATAIYACKWLYVLRLDPHNWLRYLRASILFSFYADALIRTQFHCVCKCVCLLPLKSPVSDEIWASPIGSLQLPTREGEKTAKVVRATHNCCCCCGKRCALCAASAEDAGLSAAQIVRTHARTTKAQKSRTLLIPFWTPFVRPRLLSALQRVASHSTICASSDSKLSCSLQPPAHWPTAQPAALQRSLVLRLSQPSSAAAVKHSLETPKCTIAGKPSSSSR